LKVNYVYLPNKKHIYNSKRKPKIKIHKNDQILCAKYRKGHFEGVLDVMNILTKIINPNKIFMGEKDFQQLYLVKNFLERKYKTKIISCKTVRDKNQVALSSRNLLLSSKNLIIAGKIYKKLVNLKKNLNKEKNISNFLNTQKKEMENHFKIKIEYLELRDKKNLKFTNKINNSRLFIAYYLNEVRLIDNL
jgi:pantoate--beta-alanine ligase